ncbi:MAG: hypothetical protein KAS32_00255 [Candidatus Peribacteraceae bacterium]|nr:hypothetical protein [Candidatus Peribacteraceae bacterium]
MEEQKTYTYNEAVEKFIKDDELRELFIKRTQLINVKAETFVDLHDLVSSSFIWFDTKEGGDFWDNVAEGKRIQLNRK